MPDATLIVALEGLRDGYSQRQKATNGLITALKAATGALGKAGRAIREYAPTPPPGGPLAQAQQAFAALRLKDEAVDPLLPELRREAKLLTGMAAVLKDALAALRGEAVDVVRLGHACGALESSRIQDPALRQLLPGLRHELDLAQRALGDTFGLALRHALAAQGVELGGRPPRFEIGRFDLTANFVSRTATLSYGKELVIKRVPLSVDAVLAAYQREVTLISGRNEDGERWIEQLYEAWETARRKRGSADLRANIVECYLELVLLRQSKAFRSAPSRHDFTDYSRAQFAYDFYEFTSPRPVTYKGLRAFGTVATKAQTDNVERSIWIVSGESPHVGSYIADVKFDRDE
ncbi:MAG: hypothetical protein WCJ55_04930 [Chloroflexales bacterium]